MISFLGYNGQASLSRWIIILNKLESDQPNLSISASVKNKNTKSLIHFFISQHSKQTNDKLFWNLVSLHFLQIRELERFSFHLGDLTCPSDFVV